MRCQRFTLSSRERLSRWDWGTMLTYAARQDAMWMVAMERASEGVAGRMVRVACCGMMTYFALSWMNQSDLNVFKVWCGYIVQKQDLVFETISSCISDVDGRRNNSVLCRLYFNGGKKISESVQKLADVVRGREE